MSNTNKFTKKRTSTILKYIQKISGSYRRLRKLTELQRAQIIHERPWETALHSCRQRKEVIFIYFKGLSFILVSIYLFIYLFCYCFFFFWCVRVCVVIVFFECVRNDGMKARLLINFDLWYNYINRFIIIGISIFYHYLALFIFLTDTYLEIR